MTDLIITYGYGSTDLIISGGYDVRYILHPMMANAIAQMEQKQLTRSFFAPGFIEPGFDTETPLTVHFKKMEK